MRSGSNYLICSVAAAFALSACGSAAAEEPTEAQMREAMLYAMNHPPGITTNNTMNNGMRRLEQWR
jgi:hypothetical protein